MPDGSVLEERAEGKGVHSEQTFVFTDRLLSGQDVRVADLGGVIVSAGPGSYTGLRVASSAVKGLLFDTGIPLYACSTMGAFALGARKSVFGAQSGEQMPERTAGCETVIDARRTHLYHQSWRFTDGGAESLSEVKVRELEEVLDLWKSGRLVVGTGLERLEKLASVRTGQGAVQTDPLPELLLADVISAAHIFGVLDAPAQQWSWNMIKKVAPEQFEPYYYTGL